MLANGIVVCYNIDYKQKGSGDSMPMFQTIRKTASSGILTEYRLRQMLKEGRLPGIFVGNRFLVDQSALLDILHAEAAKNLVAD